MKILWLTNIALPEASILMNEVPSPFGGWLESASKVLSKEENIELSISFPGMKLNNVKKLNGKRIKYYIFPNIQMKDKDLICDNIDLTNILIEVQPDLVHIFGTEFAHSLAMVNVCKKLGIETVINIQGLVSIIAKHYTANLPLNIQRKYTFRDLFKQNNILQQKKEFEKRGLIEIEAIKKTQHIIGRTTWDYACTKQINPSANYYFCNETLRGEFYKHKWTLENCERHTIFMSQAAYPIKGLHYMLEALSILIRKHPETKLYIAGPDITASNSIKDKLKKTSYSKYIAEMIKKNNLKDHVLFMGLLNEKQMCERYLKSNLFVCPSSIENSPNSLGEAMILGVPCVASDVGGVSDMLVNKAEGFVYQADAPYMLAYYISELFRNDELALNFSENARTHALKTHDYTINTNRLIDIYGDVLRGNMGDLQEDSLKLIKEHSYD